jgi:hypothetical protein
MTIISHGVTRKTGFFYSAEPIIENRVFTQLINSEVFRSLKDKIPDNLVSETNYAKKPYYGEEIFLWYQAQECGRRIIPAGGYSGAV